MLRAIQAGANRPLSYKVDPDAHFQPGIFGQIQQKADGAALGVSDGWSVIGIIDDLKAEQIMVMWSENVRFTQPNEKVCLSHSQVVRDSFECEIGGVDLFSDLNGVVMAPPEAEVWPIDTRVWYKYKTNYREDTTAASGQCTFWSMPGIFKTNQYNVSDRFDVGCALYCDKQGRLTSKKFVSNLDSVGICIKGPMLDDRTVEFYFTGPTAHPGVPPEVFSAKIDGEYDPGITPKEAQEAIEEINAELLEEAKRQSIAAEYGETRRQIAQAPRTILTEIKEFKNCPKCDHDLKYDWTKCEGRCPIEESPDYSDDEEKFWIEKLQTKPTKAPNISLYDLAMPMAAAVIVGVLTGSQTKEFQQKEVVEA